MKGYHTPTQPHGSGPGSADQAQRPVRCFVCHRILRDPKSIERGCGPTCAERIGLLDHHDAKQKSDNVVPLFPLPDPVKRRVTIRVKRYSRPRVMCDICHRRRGANEIHPVSLGDSPAIIAACEPCISAIVRYGEQPVREYLEGRSRSGKAVS